MSAGIFKDNMSLGIAAYAKKSKGSSGGSSCNMETPASYQNQMEALMDNILNEIRYLRNF